MTDSEHKFSAATIAAQLSALASDQVDRALDLHLTSSANKKSFLHFVEFELIGWHASIDAKAVSPNASWRIITSRWLEDTRQLMKAAQQLPDKAELLEALKADYLKETISGLLGSEKDDVFFNTDEALAFLHISKPTLNDLRAKGLIATHQVSEGRVLFSKKGLVEYVKSTKVKHHHEGNETEQ